MSSAFSSRVSKENPCKWDLQIRQYQAERRGYVTRLADLEKREREAFKSDYGNIVLQQILRFRILRLDRLIHQTRLKKAAQRGHHSPEPNNASNESVSDPTVDSTVEIEADE